MSDRLLKINKLIQRELGGVILSEVELPPEALLTICRADISPDLKQARIYVSILPEDQRKRVLKILDKHAAVLQSALSKKVILRQTPRLHFLLDDTEEKAAALDRLLDNLR